jgi:transcriptional regulator with XRE-family HTH domain
MPTMVKIGDNVRRYRYLKTMTQEQLAEKAGLSAAAIVRLEQNKTEPHVSTIRKLADALEIEPAALLGEDY